MTVELPEEPKSRKEQYLADIAGQDVTLPAEPKSREEQYLAYIAENGSGGGGGGSYTAGTGIDITSNTISVDTDTIQEKLTAGTGISIVDDVISASGGSGPTVVQTPGNSQTDVMSQNAVTSMVFNDPSTQKQVQIGASSSTNGSNQVAIGYGAKAGSAVTHSDTVAIGHNAIANGGNRVAIGASTNCGHSYSVALGVGSHTNYAGEVNVGTGVSGNHGYNSTNYRIISGVHDPVDNHDAATKGYVDSKVGGALYILSTDDINLDSSTSPSGNPAIGLWLLNPGMYYIPWNIGVDVFTCSILQSSGDPSDALPNQSYSVMVDTDGAMTYLLLTSALPFAIEQNSGTPGYINRVDIDPQDSYSGVVTTVLPEGLV